ncbi:hypothetical protein BST22_22195 [Mycolicibacterium chubuense]|uniref:Glycosyl transferase family 2 n=2 Tax=Mycolicibacterium chubuense TaxID=1800 RepID=A0A0J6WRP3_MYCCU|nr:hypothetical protein MCHUDSM44219_00714 [Mycolicibacterium chubuense]ORA46315.1 hypothetical protein BST22_22195 [Mycolicibacterium chubuense]SPY00403.1 methyltransferase type 11 [Mycolicibacterium chubuense]
MTASAPGRDRAPIAVFAYNRSDKLSAMLTSLRSCTGFRESDVIIFVDGPKGPADAAAVEQVRAFVRDLNMPNVSWRFRDTNCGLRNSIYAGVSEVMEAYGRAIVLEDDLVLSPIALEYFNNALARYETDHRVWSIAGYIYDAPVLRNSDKSIAMPYAHPWGWATWARAWSEFSLDNRPSLRDLRTSSFRAAFDMDGLYPFTLQLENSLKGRVNSWFIHWYYTVFSHGGVSIFPPRRVCDNYGLNDGSHGGALNPHMKLVNRPALLGELPQFCDPNTVNFYAMDELRRCREVRVQRLIARIGSAKRTLKALR